MKKKYLLYCLFGLFYCGSSFAQGAFPRAYLTCWDGRVFQPIELDASLAQPFIDDKMISNLNAGSPQLNGTWEGGQYDVMTRSWKGRYFIMSQTVSSIDFAMSFCSAVMAQCKKKYPQQNGKFRIVSSNDIHMQSGTLGTRFDTKDGVHQVMCHSPV